MYCLNKICLLGHHQCNELLATVVLGCTNVHLVTPPIHGCIQVQQ